jgi:hypothetical protein
MADLLSLAIREAETLNEILDEVKDVDRAAYERLRKVHPLGAGVPTSVKSPNQFALFFWPKRFWCSTSGASSNRSGLAARGKSRLRRTRELSEGTPSSATDPYGEELERQRAVAEWKAQKEAQEKQKELEQKQARLHAHLRRREQEWIDTTKSVPPASVRERWTVEYMDDIAATRELEHELRVAAVEENYEF